MPLILTYSRCAVNTLTGVFIKDGCGLAESAPPPPPRRTICQANNCQGRCCTRVRTFVRVRVCASVCGSVGGWGKPSRAEKTQSDSVEGLQAARRRRQGHIRSWNRLTNALRCSATVSERSNWGSRWVFFPNRTSPRCLSTAGKTEFSAVSLFHRKKEKKRVCLSRLAGGQR